MQLEANPKQLLDLIERHRTFMMEGKLLKTPVRIGSHTVYASLDRKEFRLSINMDFSIEMDIEVPVKKGLELHEYIYRAMYDVNERSQYQYIPIEGLPTVQMYGRSFVIQTLDHTDFSNDKVRLRLGCVFTAYTEEEPPTSSENKYQWRRPFNK